MRDMNKTENLLRGFAKAAVAVANVRPVLLYAGTRGEGKGLISLP